jgi:hypothetical protein
MNERSSDRRAPRDSSWYRREAVRFRQRAATITDDNQLRDSYLSLARCYERLAEALEGRWSSWERLMNPLGAPAAPGNPVEERNKERIERPRHEPAK